MSDEADEAPDLMAALIELMNATWVLIEDEA